MALPSYDFFIEPLMRVLAKYPDGTSTRQAQHEVADAVGLTDEDKRELLPSGQQLTYHNRIGWAHDRLKRAGLSSSPRRGFWQMTPEGRTYALDHAAALSREDIAKLAFETRTVRLRPESPGAPALRSETAEVALDPESQLQVALDQIRERVQRELLEQLLAVEPSRFESIVLDVLRGAGYGTGPDDLQRVGRSGDGGIDGIISLDRLGLEKVYVQAKRWQGAVGRPEIQAFYGALAGHRATKGVFITSSDFSAEARTFANQVGIVLVNGTFLASLMVDHSIGATSRLIQVPRLDGDYFE